MRRAVFAPAMSLAEFSLAWTKSHRRQFDRYLAGELSYEAQRRARVRDVIGASWSDDEADRVFGIYLNAYERSWSLFPDVMGCLNRLTGHRLGIITNGQVHQQRSKLERLGIIDRFKGVVISEAAAVAKPSRTIFHSACAELGEPPSRCVYVGDAYDTDARGARAAGLTGIWLDRTGQFTADHAPPVIHSLLDLPAVITDWQ
jgi:putative hydrolase of the HAD superfamily